MPKTLARSKDNIPLRKSIETEPEALENEPASPEEAAYYIAQFTAELSYLARRAKLDLLAYLLDMARLEASRSAPRGQV
ncbi:hypothetical protein AB4072_00055 [Microvirga sp. 2MCAF38]|uniref:hypothetical protein n=1 Tax=Microvirga sp. 2MCAF38 TaxID=3232989 RepID=UPI003F9E0D3A